MHSTTDLAAHVLARAPARALQISHLQVLIERESGGATVELDHVVRCLHSRPGRFRLLDPWRGAWRTSAPRGPRTTGASAQHPVLAERWALRLEPPNESESAPPLRKLQDSMVAAGRRVDEHSVTAMARWLQMTLEGEELAPVLQRREAC